MKKRSRFFYTVTSASEVCVVWLPPTHSDLLFFNPASSLFPYPRAIVVTVVPLNVAGQLRASLRSSQVTKLLAPSHQEGASESTRTSFLSTHAGLVCIKRSGWRGGRPVIIARRVFSCGVASGAFAAVSVARLHLVRHRNETFTFVSRKSRVVDGPGRRERGTGEPLEFHPRDR